MQKSMRKNFYRAFEDRHRGSRQLIKSRLAAYEPFVRPFLKDANGRPSSLDLGCGRGEWLELMRDWGFSARGIDLDDGMLEACREIGLEASKDEAIGYLQSLPDESLAIVTAFHLVEHISFPDLERLVVEAHRVLQPNGLLILETPNPENIVVGTEKFYLDPTHSQPIPHPLLSFLVEHQGFSRVKVLLLQEPSGIREKRQISLRDVLESASPDYSVVGQKSGLAEKSSGWNAAFDGEYGQTLADLADRYEMGHAAQNGEINRSLERISQALQSANEAHLGRFQDVASRLVSLEKTSRDLLRDSNERIQDALRAQYEAERQQLIMQHRQHDFSRSQLLNALQQQLLAANEQIGRLGGEVQAFNNQILAIHRSTSWKLSYPIRLLGRWARRWRTAASNSHRVPAPSHGSSSSEKAAQVKEDVPVRQEDGGPHEQEQSGSDMKLTPAGMEVYRYLQDAIKRRSSGQ